MTVATTSNKKQYTGNGSTTIFAYDFLIYDEDHIQVILADANGVETIQTKTTHYTVSGVANPAGGNITFLTAPPSGHTVTLKRNQPLTQDHEWENTGDINLDKLEEVQDKGVMMAQQVDEEINRSIKVPKSSTLTDIEIPDPAITANQGKIVATKSGPPGGLELAKAADLNLLTVPLAGGDALKPVRVNASAASLEPHVHTASRALQSDASGIPEASAVTAAELAYLAGVTSGIQAQIDAITGGTLTTALTDADQTVVVPLGGARYSITPSTTRTLTLDGAAMVAGDVVEIINLAAAVKITLKSDDASTICAFQDGYMKLVAEAADPQAETDWKIAAAEGGASPKFEATLSANQAIASAADTKIEFDTETFDTNSNYDAASNYRFTPTVPGKYLVILSAYIELADDEETRLRIFLNGSNHRMAMFSVRDTGSPNERHANVQAIIDMDGIADYVEAFVDTAWDTSYQVTALVTITYFAGIRIS